MEMINPYPAIILCMCLANERWCYIVTSSPIGWVHAQNNPCLFSWIRKLNLNIYLHLLSFLKSISLQWYTSFTAYPWPNYWSNGYLAQLGIFVLDRNGHTHIKEKMRIIIKFWIEMWSLIYTSTEKFQCFVWWICIFFSWCLFSQ